MRGTRRRHRIPTTSPSRVRWVETNKAEWEELSQTAPSDAVQRANSPSEIEKRKSQQLGRWQAWEWPGVCYRCLGLLWLVSSFAIRLILAVKTESARQRGGTLHSSQAAGARSGTVFGLSKCQYLILTRCQTGETPLEIVVVLSSGLSGCC